MFHNLIIESLRVLKAATVMGIKRHHSEHLSTL